MAAPDKLRFPRAVALAVAQEIIASLTGSTEPDRLVIAGSLRRGKAEVGDVEIVFVPQIGIEKVGLFGDKIAVNFADRAIETLVNSAVLAKRLNKNGCVTWGEKNKLAVHVQTGVPVDLFATSALAWWNYLVCRTGPAELNQRIAGLAIARGWHWAPYEHGFKRVNPATGEIEWHVVAREEDVFSFVGLPYMPPNKRSASL